MTDTLLGVDIGTTGTKAVVFDTQGRALATAYRAYPLHTGAAGEAWLDPNQVLEASRQAIAEAVSATPPPVALAVACQGEAFAPVDAAGKPSGEAIVTFDRRGQIGAEILRSRGWTDREESAGIPFSWIVTAAKLAQLQAMDPERYRQPSAFLCFEDLLLHSLTGTATISSSLAQRTFLLDRHTQNWHPDSVAELELTGRLATVVPSGQAVGRVSASGARSFGLPDGCIVVAGAHDQTAALIGSGAIDPGVGAHSTGTVDCISLSVADRPLGQLAHSGYGLGLHPVVGRAVTLAFGFGGGALLSWWRSILTSPEHSPTVDALVREAEDILSTQTEPCAIPFWSGSGTPDLDARDQGALLGMTLDTSRAQMTAALIRGMVLETARNLAALHENNITVRELRLVGGGSRNLVWNTLRANLLGIPYVEVDTPEAGALGAAILAGSGVGVWASLPEACAQMVHLGRRHAPNSDEATRSRALQWYQNAVAAIRTTNNKGV